MSATGQGDLGNGAAAVTNQNFTRSPVEIAVIVTSVRSGIDATTPLAKGTYKLRGDGDYRFLQGDATVVAALDTTSHRMLADEVEYFHVSDPTNNGFIAAIRITAEGEGSSLENSSSERIVPVTAVAKRDPERGDTFNPPSS